MDKSGIPYFLEGTPGVENATAQIKALAEQLVDVRLNGKVDAAVYYVYERSDDSDENMDDTPALSVLNDAYLPLLNDVLLDRGAEPSDGHVTEKMYGEEAGVRVNLIDEEELGWIE